MWHDSFIRNMTPSYVSWLTYIHIYTSDHNFAVATILHAYATGRDSFICDNTWTSHETCVYESCVYESCVYVCMSHVCMCVWVMCVCVYESCVYVCMSHVSQQSTPLLHQCVNESRQNVWTIHDKYVNESLDLAPPCRPRLIHTCHDSFIRDMTQYHTWHDSFIRDMTHIHKQLRRWLQRCRRHHSICTRERRWCSIISPTFTSTPHLLKRSDTRIIQICGMWHIYIKDLFVTHSSNVQSSRQHSRRPHICWKGARLKQICCMLIACVREWWRDFLANIHTHRREWKSRQHTQTWMKISPTKISPTNLANIHTHRREWKMPATFTNTHTKTHYVHLAKIHVDPSFVETVRYPNHPNMWHVTHTRPNIIRDSFIKCAIILRDSFINCSWLIHQLFVTHSSNAQSSCVFTRALSLSPFHMYSLPHAHTFTHTHTHTHTHAHWRARTHTYTFAHTVNTHTHTHTVHTHTYVYTRVHNAHTNTHTYAHTLAHTLPHTHFTLTHYTHIHKRTMYTFQCMHTLYTHTLHPHTTHKNTNALCTHVNACTRSTHTLYTNTPHTQTQTHYVHTSMHTHALHTHTFHMCSGQSEVATHIQRSWNILFVCSCSATRVTTRSCYGVATISRLL